MIDLVILITDVVVKATHDHVVESYVGITKFSAVDWFDGIGDRVDSNAADVLEGLPGVLGGFWFQAE